MKFLNSKRMENYEFIFLLYIKGRSPYNVRMSVFCFYIDSQISVHRKFNK